MNYQELEAAINAEFKRLEVDTEAAPYSGLTAEVVEEASMTIVNISDDYAGGFYTPDVLSALKRLKYGITIEEVWDVLYDYQV